MPRDNFSRKIIDRLAKRAGMRCSMPDCRAPTSGPATEETGVTNIGVAAHICAASPGGARYEETMTSEERASITNGIWLCQTHAKLIDDDEIAFPPSLLKDWKDTAEKMAALETRGFVVKRAMPFANLDKKAPNLLDEMRSDLKKYPLIREFIILSKRFTYSGSARMIFRYYTEDHEYIDSIMTIMEHAGAIYDVSFNKVPRYNFTEEFVHYLVGNA